MKNKSFLFYFNKKFGEINNPGNWFLIRKHKPISEDIKLYP